MRTPLFASVRRAFRLARQAQQPGAPPPAEIVQHHRELRLTRRQMLLGTAALALAGCGSADTAIPAGTVAPPATAPAPRIAIVGAGIAGLNAALTLQDDGLASTIYEASSSRAGGRILTLRDFFGPGLNTELGAEFIDSSHTEMLSLCRRFNLALLDTADPNEDKFDTTFVVDGQRYTEEDVLEAFIPVAQRMVSDYQGLPANINFTTTDPAAVRFDQLSVTQYFDLIGVGGFLRRILDVAYTTEFGTDVDGLSSLNVLEMVGEEPGDILGDSDERYKIAAGNDALTRAIQTALIRPIEFGHRLVALRQTGTGYTMSFEGQREVSADVVLLTLPFSTLRQVDVNFSWPEPKGRAIRDLSYGTNTKLILGANERIWREDGFSGNYIAQLPLQEGWDSTRLQPGTLGSLTQYYGGRAGVQAGEGTPEARAAAVLPALDAVFPGFTPEYNGKVQRAFWPGNPLSRGSYSNYGVGQWTSIKGSQFPAFGNLHFAGEHTSTNFLGFMEGGAETGRRAAQAIAASLGALKA